MTVLLYGAPTPGLVEIPAGAVQVSPLIPGSQDLAAMADASAGRAVILAPGGVIERDYVLAQAMRVLRPGAPLLAFAPKDRGGGRLKKVLEGFGAKVAEDARRHHRFCQTTRPEAPTGLAEAIAAGAPRLSPSLGVWTQPGVFSWDRIDPGTALLLQHLPPLAGTGADLGCGLGLLAQRILASPTVTALACIDIDRRAVDCARRNLDDPRAHLAWADVRKAEAAGDLDFVVTNPPFHDGGVEDRSLGMEFLAKAAAMLRRGGVCWLVANRRLPYEQTLGSAFGSFSVRDDRQGYKVIEARR